MKTKAWPKERIRTLQDLLLDWYERHRRELPWRSHPSPYRVWISEIMLQQTQVRTVLPYYERFLRRFPDIRTLAEAPEQDVLAAWAGLGYYSRARNLQRAARVIVGQHDGEFPRKLEDILKLPGVGRYTAGAIASIAFNRPQPVVDGNVRRVMSRLHGIESRTLESFFWDQAKRWIAPGRASDFNQALMELGALVCIPSLPRCLICPVQSLCEARRRGIQTRIPPLRSTRAQEVVRLMMLVLARDGSVLLARRRDAAYIPGEWGLPTQALRDDDIPERVARLLARNILRGPVHLEACPVVRHSITFRQIIIHVFRGEMPAGPIDHGEQFCWSPRTTLSRRLTSSVFRKVLDSAGALELNDS
jgi:A/G-specific adenine glycosylase